MVAQTEAFKQAVIDSKKLTAKPSNEELLDIYALYKGKAKKNAWQKIVDEEITPEEAQERYVAYIEKLKEKYGYDADKVPETVGSS